MIVDIWTVRIMNEACRKNLFNYPFISKRIRIIYKCCKLLSIEEWNMVFIFLFVKINESYLIYIVICSCGPMVNRLISPVWWCSYNAISFIVLKSSFDWSSEKNGKTLQKNDKNIGIKNRMLCWKKYIFNWIYQISTTIIINWIRKRLQKSNSSTFGSMATTHHRLICDLLILHLFFMGQWIKPTKKCLIKDMKRLRIKKNTY